jgi:hypothetical protein
VSVSQLRLRAPQRHGEFLAAPPLASAADLVARNRAGLAGAPVVIDGIPLPDLRRHAVRECLRAAQSYLHGSGVSVPDHADSVVLAGHQPELFHAGVWVKSFALNGLARTSGSVPLNLIVDNDTAKGTSVRVPVWDADPAGVRLASVPFDHFAGEVPYEERGVVDDALFNSFPDRVADLTRPWEFEPILSSFWPDVLRHRTPLMGERFAAARRALERRWGCTNLELPLSALCRTDAFLHFARAILADLPAFGAVYNEQVNAYRRRHAIRSRHHPVPDLAADGDWLEAPFWAWRSGAGRRGRLFVRRAGDRLHIRAGDDELGRLPAHGDLGPWRHLADDGVNVRTRALTTTLFARLVLGDLFVHGIGGGLYDELTDDIIRGCYHIEPPAFVVFTGTLHLPLPRFPADAGRLNEAGRRVRDLYWNPQRHLTVDDLARPDVRSAVAERNRWERVEPREQVERLWRFQRLRELTERLRPCVASQLASARRRRDTFAREMAANGVLSRRDFAFCLFPEATIRPFCTQFLHPAENDAARRG